MSRSRVPITWLSHIITRIKPLKNPTPIPPNLPNQSRNFNSRSYPFQFNPIPAKPTFCFTQTRHFCYVSDYEFSENEEDAFLQEWLVDIEREKHKMREEKRKRGELVDEGEEEKEDYTGAGPFIEWIDAECAKPKTILDKLSKLDFLDEPTDSDDSEEEEAGDPVLMEQEKRMDTMFKKLTHRHNKLLDDFTGSRTLDDAFKLMNKIDKFEEKHFRLLPEYRVIAELLNRFKDATGKDKFLLAQKLNRAWRLVGRKEKFNPNDSGNYAVLQREDGEPVEFDHEDIEPGEKAMIEGRGDDDDEEEEFDDMKERDDILLGRVNAIDRMLEEKLAALDHTFGKKGKVLEVEIRDLAQERNSLTEKKTIPMYRKGFDVRLVDVNRTCKVTKGGQVIKYSAIVACGNYNGVVGYAKARGPAVPIAIQKAHEKCFQNLHYIDRYEDHTIAHAIQTKYKKTKIYLWPARTVKGLKAGKTVEIILNLAGFKNIRSKVIGSRNPHNTVKALFQALNAIETPKDVQEKFGRTVVESYLVDESHTT